MNKLKTEFTKNGLHYRLTQRNELVAMFKLSFEGHVCGWEVSRIYHQKERTSGERHYSECEILAGNEAFGMEGSKAFHQNSQQKAESYFNILTSGLKEGIPPPKIWADFKNGLLHGGFKPLSPDSNDVAPLRAETPQG